MDKPLTLVTPDVVVDQPAQYAKVYPIAKNHSYLLQVPKPIWNRAQRRAHGRDQQSIRFVLIKTLELYAEGKMEDHLRKPSGHPTIEPLKRLAYAAGERSSLPLIKLDTPLFNEVERAIADHGSTWSGMVDTALRLLLDRL
jgi:hypothetical protein